MSILQRIPPFVVREQVFADDAHSALLEWTLANRAVLVPSRVAGNVHDPARRNSLSLPAEVEAPWREPLVARIVELVPELLPATGLAPFAIDRIDSELVAYNEGSFLARHIDIATRATRHPSDRVLSIVYYFHREPKGFTGGALRIAPRMPPPLGEPAHADIEPRQNVLVAFPSWAPHEVLPVGCPSGAYEDSRFAINFWVRRARSDQGS